MGGKFTKPEVESKFFDEFVAGLPSMAGKSLAISGTTSGLGAVAARTFASKGGTVFVLNRPSERAQASLNELKSACQGGGSVTQIPCDLQNFKSVHKAAESVIAAVGASGLDVLCNNAGTPRA